MPRAAPERKTTGGAAKAAKPSRPKAPGADAIILARLTAGATRAEAAKAAGVSETTVYRKLQEAEFAGQLRELRRAIVDAATGRALSLVGEALDTMGELLKSGNDGVRLGAARTILDSALRLHEQNDLAERLAALEDAAAIIDDAKASNRGRPW
jgi:hypothetical protein